jgi:hypothetical protein
MGLIYVQEYGFKTMVEVSAKIRLSLAEDFLAFAEKSEKFLKTMFF